MHTTWMHTHTHAHTQTRTRTHARTRTHTHTNTHTHTHTHNNILFLGDLGKKTNWDRKKPNYFELWMLLFQHLNGLSYSLSTKPVSFIVIGFLFQHNQHSKTGQQNAGKYPSSHFSPCSCCLSVVLWFRKGYYPENLHVMIAPNKQRSFWPRMCLDHVLKR